MSYLGQTRIELADTPAIDAFSRLRVSQTANLFDAQFTYDLSPLQFEQITAETGATISHDATNRMANLAFASTPTGGQSYMQSYEYVPYQPGRSQLVFVTFNMQAGVANVLKFAGLSDGVDGVEYQLNGTTRQIALLSSTTAGNQTITQANWNLDTLDGTGPSGVTLDDSKTQILVIDFQALYVGRVRVGFDINGLIYFAHEFNHANAFTHPYFSRATLPVRCGMTCTGTVTAAMNFICSAVASEGGLPEPLGRSFSYSANVTAGNETATHALSLRPKLLFNSITNRTLFQLESISLLVRGNSPVKWQMALGQAISGTTTFNDVNTIYSGFEYNTAGTISGSPALVFSEGFVGATNQQKGTASKGVSQRYPVTLDQSGAHRAMGTMTVVVTGLGGASDVDVNLTWREVR